MKFLKQIIFILIVFFKTGNLLSSDNIFSVNNILLEKKDNISNKQLANEAIKKAYNQLIQRVLLKEDVSKVSNLKLSNIIELVTYYNISKKSNEEKNKISYSVTFDKDKIHDLLYKKKILYSDIAEKELFILPILLKENEIFIFSNNYFYTNWNKTNSNKVIEFILPLENIETIQNINKSRNNLLDLKLETLFEEYPDNNIAVILIEERFSNEENIYIKARIQNKIITKNLKIKKNNSKKMNLVKK